MKTEIEDKANKVVRVIYSDTKSVRAEFADTAYRTNLHTSGDHASSWMPGGWDREKAIQACTLGIPDNVPLIMEERKRAERLDVAIPFPTWDADIAGAFPYIPAFLAGDPMSMRRLNNIPNDNRTIRIFVGMASSSSFDVKQLAKRGALVSALGLQLSKTRSVEIYAVNAGSYYRKVREDELDWVCMVRLPMPASASDLSYWICHQASVRGILYAIERTMTGQLSWPLYLCQHSGNYFTPAAMAEQARLFGATETDIVIPFPYAGTNAQAEILNNPDVWMKATLERVNGTY